MPTSLGYDKRNVYSGLVLGLPFEEATGLLTCDVAKPNHHDVDLNGPPTWVSLANGLGMLDFNEATTSEYLDCPNADTTDLDFTSGDYSIAVWVNHGAVGVLNPKILVGRYYIDNGVQANNVGWELYLETNGPDYLEQRHHHGSIGPWPPPATPPRDGCCSIGWATGVWNFLVSTRSGLSVQHYRDAVALAMTIGANGMRDPDTVPTPTNRDLVIGTRCTKNQDWYDGSMWYLRIWNRELSPDEVRFLFECERHWFGV